MNGSSKTPNPERIYSTIATILSRRYDVRIEYALIKKGA